MQRSSATWTEGALLLFLFTLSGALETYAMGRTRKAIESLSKLRPDVATVRQGDHEVEVARGQLAIGDVVVVKPGERLPVDGTVMYGTSSIDQSAITGESMPVSKWTGDHVFAGTINGGGALEVKVTKSAGESHPEQDHQAGRRGPAGRHADPAVHRSLQPALHLCRNRRDGAGHHSAGLFLDEPFGVTLYRAMTLLVVASPCALVISTPGQCAERHRRCGPPGRALQGWRLPGIVGKTNIIAFDKTGTLTPGSPVVTNIHPLTGYTADELLHMAASAETLSEHHIAQRHR